MTSGFVVNIPEQSCSEYGVVLRDLRSGSNLRLGLQKH